MSEQKEEHELDTVIGLIMRVGVIVSFAIIAIGSALLFSEGQTGYSGLGTAEQLVVMRNLSLVGLQPLVQGVFSAKPYAVIDLGVVALLATPFIRVGASALLFLQEKRYVFVLISVVVLAILLFSSFYVAPFFSA